jgi:AcrR family transcriptional regulator
MWPERSVSTAQSGARTFTENARRAQIVAAAIDTIAELGYGQASLARIAARVGVSKGVISYHFAGKEDLVRELLGEVLARAEAYMGPRIPTGSAGPVVLRAYIESNLSFMGEYRNHLLAIVEIAQNARDAGGRRLLDVSALGAGAGALVDMLARFQARGELRDDFDPAVMAMAIREAIDAVPRRMARDPGLDVAHVGRELANLFDRATRPEMARRRRS